MSSSTSNDVMSALQTVVEDESERLVDPLKGVAFWAAVALPFLHLPLLAAGLATEGRTMAFVALLTMNVAALLVGHPYHRE
ncbi:hypothetical protein ACKVMT_06860 [Halobacteriales archaeon Cl-PHB]